MSALPAWAGKYIGIPFVDHGRTREGLDCWGLAKLVLEAEFGICDLPDYTARYAHTRDRNLPQVFEEEMARWRAVKDPLAGDVAVLRYGGRPMHVGLVVAQNWILTISRGTASCLDRLDSPRWTGKLEGFFRHA
jgi:cell wall-associated NlpC family hydrolase